MVKRLVLSTCAAVVLAALWSAAALAAPPNLTGKWTVEQTGPNGTVTSEVSLKQSGMAIVGTTSKGNGINGEFVSDTQINGKWNGPGGAGWLTVYVSPNGHSFNGTWGYNGRKANGSFVGNKFLPPSPITAAGTWHVIAAGGSPAMVGRMACTQSGAAAICQVNQITISGKITLTEPNKIRATWKNANGNTGWFSFWFNNDNNSFNGVWGTGADTTPPQGRVVGQRSLGG